MKITDKIYYVYLHTHPENKEVVYCGKGTGGRAWDITRNKSQMHPDHIKWMMELQQQGYTPQDWVCILYKGLSESEAFELETQYRHNTKLYKFDRMCGEKNHHAKLTNKQVLRIFLLCKNKERTHQQIAQEFGVSRAAISMIASRKQWKAVTACLV
jgi:hypothetical protein